MNQHYKATFEASKVLTRTAHFSLSGRSRIMLQLVVVSLAVLQISFSAEYINPILARDFPDPCILSASDGNYYVYATNTADIHFQVAMSTDGVNFEYKGDAMPSLPSWATGSTQNWAPHVIQYNETSEYYMYFVAASNELNGTRCIGVAKSKSPLGPFVDASLVSHGSVFLCM